MTVSTLLAILRRTKRQAQPRVIVYLEVFAPDDHRAVEVIQ